MREADKVVYAIIKQLSADLSALQAMLQGSVINMHYAEIKSTIPPIEATYTSDSQQRIDGQDQKQWVLRYLQ